VLHHLRLRPDDPEGFATLPNRMPRRDSAVAVDSFAAGQREGGADAAYAAAEDARRAGVAVKAAAQADAENTAQALADASRASGSEEPSRLSFRRPPDPGVGLLGQVTEQPLHSADSARNSSALAAEGERWVRGDCRYEFPA
jgi:hypothetical protein